MSITPALIRHRRDYDLVEVPEPCDFGSVIQLTTCYWNVTGNTTRGKIHWRSGMGASSYWIGGPRADHTGGDKNSGYVFYETSELSSYGELPRSEYSSNQLIGPEYNHTGPSGLCLSFFYSIAGLSAKSLRVVLRNSLKHDTILWESKDNADGTWYMGEVAFSYGQKYSILFEAVATNQSLKKLNYRGYVALDDVRFDTIPNSEVCIGHCTFEGGFCDWNNMDEDDFDWELGRGSNSFLTGPPRDYSSFGKNEQTGGFAYISTAYPRRPGDTAMLRSPSFPTTGDNSPVCMRFATHMFGNGVGTLRLVLKNEDESDKTIWEMSGTSGSSWHKAQVTLSSLSPFQLLLIAIVGNQFGNIAIDDISFRPGPCPVVPQTAAKDNGDCNFEENMCNWSNPAPQDELDDVDWARQYFYDQSGPPFDHTRGDGKGYYMNLLTNTPLILKGGTRGWLVSSRFQPTANPKCVSFHYWMYERLIDPAGLSLGSLRVYVRLIKPGKPLSPLWRLYNHQGQRWFPARAPIVTTTERAPPQTPYEIVFEGVWGEGRVGNIAIDDITFFDGDCTTEPLGAAAVLGECFFERDMCGWIPVSEFDDDLSTVAPTTEPKTVNTVEESLWKMARVDYKPAGLLDHTFRSPVGYIFFDVFHKSAIQRPKLRSPLLEVSFSGVRCLGFWFVAFGRSDATALKVVLLDMSDPESIKRTVIWRLEARNFANASRTDWSYAQVSVEAKGDYLLHFEGESSDGGFALDDVTFFDGSCHTRPPAAVGKG
ncbi:MAM and LDL-receptor class A domain-containing protein 2 [Caerostris darwini]|uniref:MAM and LDL-receptor class A domain-containing protein 2 n=1 Tax=Caerostris darwini TaxID=1538125 RepID=A0AAV4PVF2_9ARAC|nr:MAM and LDL-receptor class A domain-containing protein 2 [Caerostris darwini]